MAAAYAALVSVMHIIDQIQNHPRRPISLHKEQVESLTENVTFLQEFLEGYSHHVGYSKEADPLESRIADAAHAAEDVIESYVVDRIQARFRSPSNRRKRRRVRGQQEVTSHGEKISYTDFCKSLQKVIEDMDSIKKEVMEIKEKTGVRDQLLGNSKSTRSLGSSSSTGQNNIMVGFDGVLSELMDKLIGGQQNRQIIPIVGMGGIGKTTLARNIYAKPLIKEHFDICAWTTISQEYNAREILREVLCQVKKDNRGDSSEMNENELGEKLYKHLSGRRYLIVMDDLWSIEAWDKVKFFFPDNGNESRIIVTTRLSNLAFQLTNSYSLGMKCLDEVTSWGLFCRTVFGEEGCPLDELEEIGKKIVKNCKGLPLSIVVIGRLLAKSRHTPKYWEYIAENLISVVNSQDNESCLRVLQMSYNQLPVHLKPCFLYMGVFKEDNAIRVSTLIKLWVAEGFLKPISGKSLEEVAKDYLEELISRNLILVHELGSTKNIKFCNMHDLLRDLCLREAQNERFYNVTGQHNLDTIQGINIQRRIVFPKGTPEEKVLHACQSMSHTRSLICDIEGVLPSINFRLLRILKTWTESFHHKAMYLLEDVFQLVNSRYLEVRAHRKSLFTFSIHRLWNLQILIVNFSEMITEIPAEIWKLPQLKHVEFRREYYLPGGFHLPDPPNGNVDWGDDIVLKNLQTLLEVEDFKCGEEVIKRIPNLKKLKISYGQTVDSHLNYLARLDKLESFRCMFSPTISWYDGTGILQNVTFPNSLKKLNLDPYITHLEDLLEKIGSLPLLEKLKLKRGSFKGRKWETVEGQFPSLKFLEIYFCWDLEYWTTESGSFPRLEYLYLRSIRELKKVPSGIGETLQSIHLYDCSSSVVISAKEILEEQQELGNEGLQVRVFLSPREDQKLKRLASPNFQVNDMWKNNHM